MPLYEFACRKCEHRFEELVFGDEQVACPECTSTRLERLVTSEPLNGTLIPVEVATHVAGILEFVSGAVVSIVMSGAAILLSCWGLVGLLLSVRAGAASAEPRPKNVLLLFSDFGQRTNFLDVFETSLRAQDPDPITFYEAYLDPPHGGEDSYLQSAAETLRGRYSGLTLDAVVAAGPSALQFAVKYRDKIFPGVPIAFIGLATRQFAGQTWPGVTGLTTPVGL